MEYPIQVVAKRTGLSAGTLRAWERRYRGIEPNRDEKGRRRYSEELVTKLAVLSDLVRSGYRIGEVAALEVDQLRELRSQLSVEAGTTNRTPNVGSAQPAQTGAESRAPETGSNAEERIEEALAAARALDDLSLYRVVEEAATSFGRLDIVDLFIFPLNRRVKEMAEEGELKQTHVALVRTALRAVLSSLLIPRDEDSTRPVVLIAVPYSQKEELGMMASALHAYAAGWRPVLLGSGVPAEELVDAAGGTGARAVVLSVVTERYDFGVWDELTRARRALGDELPVYFGGRMPDRLMQDLVEAGLHYLGDMDDLRATLAAQPA
jgi:DNA-binding transcriptional MerR regulator/methylmalonyl-CoA mutase cobalamin-binding subunit